MLALTTIAIVVLHPQIMDTKTDHGIGIPSITNNQLDVPAILPTPLSEIHEEPHALPIEETGGTASNGWLPNNNGETATAKLFYASLVNKDWFGDSAVPDHVNYREYISL